MRLIVFLIFLLRLACPGLLQIAFAAEVRHEANYLCHYKLVGEIEKGDLSKIEKIPTGYVPVVLCLNSPGGSFLEGMNILEYVWEKNIHTLVLPGEECQSACALILMSGGEWTGTTGGRIVGRFISPGAIVGFHGPSLQIPNGRSVRAEIVNGQYLGALRAASKLFDLSQTGEAGDSIFPEFVLGMVLRTPGDRMYLIDTIGDLNLSGLEIVGISEDISGIPLAELAQNACENSLVRSPKRDDLLSIGADSRAQYQMSIDPRDADIRAQFPLGELRVTNIESGSAGERYILARPFYSGHNLTELQCVVKAMEDNKGEAENWPCGTKPLTRKTPKATGSFLVGFAEVTIEDDGSPSHQDDALPATEVDLAKFNFSEVPCWWAYSSSKRLSSLPTKPKIIEGMGWGENTEYGFQ